MGPIQRAFEAAVMRNFAHMQVDLDKAWDYSYIKHETNLAFTYFIQGCNAGMAPNFGVENEY